MIRLLLACLKVGFFTVGGAAGIFPVLADELVTKGHWLTSQEFVFALTLCRGTPGPVMAGMGLAGVKWGGVFGGLLVIAALTFPGIVWIVAIGNVQHRFREHRAVIGFLDGVRPAIPGFLAALVYQLGSEGLGSVRAVLILSVALLLIWRWSVPPALLIVFGIVGSFFL